MSAEKRAAIAPQLKGKSLSNLLPDPDGVGLDAVRDGALYAYNMWVYQDAEFLKKVCEAKRAGQNVGRQGLELALINRCAIRSVNDGRYRFSRYFSPLQHNLPRRLEQIFEFNDLELFDLRADPDEMNNLAADPKVHADLLVAMNEKLTKLIEDEIGEDKGEFLPENKAGWNVTMIDP